MPALRIHWCSPLDSGQQKASEKYDTGALDFAGIVDFAQEADELGIDSLLMGISYHMPDPLPMIGALVRETERVKFILAYRPGLVPPTLFTQIVNTVSWMSDKRISLNLVAGISPDEQAFYGDFVAHDGRYERTGEFLDILHRFWSGESPLTCLSYLEPSRLAQWPKRYRLLQHARGLNLIAHKPGLFAQSHVRHRLEALSSFHNARFRFSEGARIAPTVDLNSSPGAVFLLHPLIERINADYNAWRGWEKDWL